MSRIKALIIILTVAVLAGLGFVYKDRFLNLISGKLPKNSENKTIKITEPVQTRKVDIADLALPDGFPSKFPSLAGADIIESYNLVNVQTGQTKEAAIVLTSTKSPAGIKNFYTERLTPPNYIFVDGSDKSDTDTSKTLVFSVKDGLLILRIEKAGTDSKITATYDTLAF